MIAIARGMHSEPPDDTGEAHPTGLIGIARPGILRAEYPAEADKMGNSDEVRRA